MQAASGSIVRLGRHELQGLPVAVLTRRQLGLDLAPWAIVVVKLDTGSGQRGLTARLESDSILYNLDTATSTAFARSTLRAVPHGWRQDPLE